MPPPRTSAPSQPDSNIVVGPRKRRPPAYFAENGDPLVARKKARQVSGEPTKAKSVSAEEEAREEVSGTPQPPHRPLLIPADQSLRGNSDAPSHSSTPKSTDSNTTLSDESEHDDEPEAEDDITELSMSFVPLFMSH